MSRNPRTGVSISRMRVIPAGITTISPASGSGPPPQVNRDDHKSMYE